ncbi:MAG: DUF2922 domain-containing protein [Bacillota bacterium]
MIKTKLEMDFLDVLNKNYRISINDPRADLTDIEVFASMDSILGTNVFESRNGNLVDKVGARVVTTQIDEMAV